MSSAPAPLRRHQRPGRSVRNLHAPARPGGLIATIGDLGAENGHQVPQTRHLFLASPLSRRSGLWLDERTDWLLVVRLPTSGSTRGCTTAASPTSPGACLSRRWFHRQGVLCLVRRPRSATSRPQSDGRKRRQGATGWRAWWLVELKSVPAIPRQGQRPRTIPSASRRRSTRVRIAAKLPTSREAALAHCRRRRFSTSQHGISRMPHALDLLPTDTWRWLATPMRRGVPIGELHREPLRRWRERDLADTFGNLINRCLEFAASAFDGSVPAGRTIQSPPGALVERLDQKAGGNHHHQEALEVAQRLPAAVRSVEDRQRLRRQIRATGPSSGTISRAAIVTRTKALNLCGSPPEHLPGHSFLARPASCSTSERRPRRPWSVDGATALSTCPPVARSHVPPPLLPQIDGMPASRPAPP